MEPEEVPNNTQEVEHCANELMRLQLEGSELETLDPE